jgi:hypothetical protein
MLVPAFHDDRVDHAGEHLLELLHGLLLRGPEERGPELLEQVVGGQRGCKVVLSLETAPFGLQGHDLPLEGGNAVAARLFGELARLECRQIPVDRGSLLVDRLGQPTKVPLSPRMRLLPLAPRELGDLLEEGRVGQGIECHAEDGVLHRVGGYPILIAASGPVPLPSETCVVPVGSAPGRAHLCR